MSVSGKVALITGGANGIGFAIAKDLLKNQAKGVCLVDVADASGTAALSELQTLFGKDKAIFVGADVSKDDELENAFKKVVDVYSQLDIVFNNAGIMDESDWKKTVDVNLCGVLRGTFLAMYEYLPKYKSGEEGVIVNTASVVAFEPYPVATTYSATKAAIVSLGRNLSDKAFYDKYKVKILTLCPGVVDTYILHILPEKSLFPEISANLQKEFTKTAAAPEFIAEKVVEILDKAANGSIWFIYDKPAVEVVFPTFESLLQTSD